MILTLMTLLSEFLAIEINKKLLNNENQHQFSDTEHSVFIQLS